MGLVQPEVAPPQEIRTVERKPWQHPGFVIPTTEDDNQNVERVTLWKDELGGVRGPLLLGVQENKQTREEQNNRIRTIARLVSVCLVPRVSCL